MAMLLSKLVKDIDVEIRGSHDPMISGVAALDKATAGELSFLAGSAYRSYVSTTQASAVILSEQDYLLCPKNMVALITNNPSLIYAQLATRLYPIEHKQGQHPSAVVAESCQIGNGVSIGPHCVIEADVVLGDNVNIGAGCVIQSGCQIAEGSHLVANVHLGCGTRLGKHNLIHPGVVIGSDGFGYANNQGQWVKIPQLGKVVIGDNVEIGANTTIDRGAMGDTVIANGVKIDNLVQIAHNVEIGEHTAIAGCVGIAGSVKIGAYCMIAGGAGIAGHLNITDKVIVTGMSLVTNSIKEAGSYSSGVPLEKTAQWRKNCVRFKQLDTMARVVRQLKKLL